MRKPAFCISENKGAFQLRSNCTADQRLCFCHIDVPSLYFLNPKFQASGHLLWPYSLFYVGRLETPKTGFLATRLIKSIKPHISDHSKVVLLIWFSVLLVLVSVSVLFSPSMHLGDI